MPPQLSLQPQAPPTLHFTCRILNFTHLPGCVYYASVVDLMLLAVHFARLAVDFTLLVLYFACLTVDLCLGVDLTLLVVYFDYSSCRLLYVIVLSVRVHKLRSQIHPHQGVHHKMRNTITKNAINNVSATNVIFFKRPNILKLIK